MTNKNDGNEKFANRKVFASKCEAQFTSEYISWSEVCPVHIFPWIIELTFEKHFFDEHKFSSNKETCWRLLTVSMASFFYSESAYLSRINSQIHLESTTSTSTGVQFMKQRQNLNFYLAQGLLFSCFAIIFKQLIIK